MWWLKSLCSTLASQLLFSAWFLGFLLLVYAAEEMASDLWKIRIHSFGLLLRASLYSGILSFNIQLLWRAQIPTLSSQSNKNAMSA